MEKIFSLDSLAGKSRCNLRRSRKINLKTEKNENSEKNETIKTIIKECLTETMLSYEEIKKRVTEAFEIVNCPTESTRKIRIEDSVRLIMRYLNCETRKPIPVRAKVIKIFGVRVFVAPDLVFYDEAENSYEIVKLYCSKPVLKQEGNIQDACAGQSLSLFALAAFGRTLLRPGTTGHIKASFYYLRKSGDKNTLEETKFDEDFFNNKNAGNIVSIEENFTAPLYTTCLCPFGMSDQTRHSCLYEYSCLFKAETRLDQIFEPQFKEFLRGNDEGAQDYCDKCELKDACGYKCPPVPIKKERKTGSIKNISLTIAQEEAIRFSKGICRINAGAGAGKTLVVALRTVKLLETGIKPEEICLLTFTKTGAEEMKERISSYNDELGIGADISRLISTTFNAFGDAIVKREFRMLGFPEVPEVIDDVERSGIIAELLNMNPVAGIDYRNFDMDMKNCRGALPMAKKVFDVIKSNKFQHGQEKEIIQKLGNDAKFLTEESAKELIELYEQYSAILKEKALIEFADQEVLLLKILKQDPYYMEDFGFKHIIVDEFQDSSEGQIELIQSMVNTKSFQSLMVVGDDSQSIFGFRGTSPKYIIQFFELMQKKGEDIYLLENHRSTPEIIDFANTINSLNTSRVVKDLVATRPHGKKPVVQGFYDKNEEYRFIVSEIKRALDSGRKCEEIAFIASTKFELLAMADILEEANIPSVLLNPEPMLENSRVIAGLSLINYLQDIADVKGIFNFLNAERHGMIFHLDDKKIMQLIKEKQAEALYIRSLPEEIQLKKIREMLHGIDEEDEVYEGFLSALEYKKDIRELFQYCNNFAIYGAKNAVKREKDYPGIVLTTAHSSKGLEWPVVFNSITKYDDAYIRKNKAQIEEKRRLLFVSATRARDELYITGQFIAYGKTDNYVLNMFLKDSYEASGQVFDYDAIIEGKKSNKTKK